MRGVPKRRHEWLLGRCAAKDAVRELIEKQHGVKLGAADIEIVPDAHGRPEVQGAWMARLNVKPAISITHSHGIAAAAATLTPGAMVGIDIEMAGRHAEHFERIAFREEERAWLQKLPAAQHDEWALRLWTAKEAASKALGQGFHQGLHALHMAAADTLSGKVDLQISGALESMFPKLIGKTIAAHSERDGSLMAALVFYEA